MFTTTEHIHLNYTEVHTWQTFVIMYKHSSIWA